MKDEEPKTLPEPDEALYRIQRALAGHVSYLAACETNKTFTEYILYEPVLRILMTRGYSVQCEFPCPGIPKMQMGATIRGLISTPLGRPCVSRWRLSGRGKRHTPST